MTHERPRVGSAGFLFLLLIVGLSLAVVGNVGGFGARLGKLFAPEPEKTKSLPAAPGAALRTPVTPARSLIATPAAGGELPLAAPMTEAWFVDADGYAGAEAERKGANAGMVVYFSKRPSEDCRRVERELLGAPDVKAFLSHVVRVRVDIGNSERENDLANQLGVLSAPALVAVAPDGTRRQIHLRTDRGTWLSPQALLAALR